MQGTRQVAQRIVNAERAFAETIQGIAPCTDAEAAAVTALYRRLRVAKLDPVGGTIRVTHGAYLDREAVDNALAMVREEQAA